MIVDHGTALAINGVIAALFIPLLLVGTGSTIARAVRMRVEHQRLPIVLKRDLVSRTGLTVPIAAIVLVRAFGITNLTDNLLWIVPTGLSFIVSVATYAYFELFVIEKPRYYDRRQPSPQLDRLEAAMAENTRVSQAASDHADAAYHEANTINQKIADQGAQIVAQGERQDRRDASQAKLQVVADDTAGEVHDIHDVTVKGDAS